MREDREYVRTTSVEVFIRDPKEAELYEKREIFQADFRSGSPINL